MNAPINNFPIKNIKEDPLHKPNTSLNSPEMAELRKIFLWGAVCVFLMPYRLAWAGSDSLTYDVYAGGIHALSAHLTLEERKDSYAVALRSQTYGLLKSLAPWSGEFSSEGWIKKDGKLQPEKHQSKSKWRGSVESKEFLYTKAGEFRSYTVEEKGEDKTPPKEEIKALAAGTTDILSATLKVMTDLPPKNPCTGKAKVFDGDRNFILKFSEIARETLKKSQYNMYAGPAVSCAVEVIPGEGKWRKKPRGWLSIQEQGRKKGALPTIWFAPLGVGAHRPWLPVKVQVKTDYGALLMHLTSYQAK